MATPSIRSSINVEDLALELGASVTREDGSIFNAARRSGASRLARVSTPEAPAQPAPPPSPPPPDTNAELLQRVVELLARPPVAPEVHLPVAQAPAPRKWNFKVHYVNGRLDSIEATST